MIEQPLKVLDMELTNRCNAGCPLCVRTGTFKGGVSRMMENQGTLDLPFETFSNMILSTTALKLDTISYCGTFGDPLMHPDPMQIFVHAAEAGIPQQVINTNGSIRSKKWWSQLGELPGVRVQFAVDGLSDTNHIYRRFTDFEKIMENAQAFIDAGGVAEWDYIVFKHNEHQIDEARKLADDMGFKFFRTKLSTRGFTHNLRTITKPYRKRLTDPIEDVTVEASTLPDYWNKKIKQTYTEQKKVKCKAFYVFRSLYITPDQIVLPCCWVHVDWVRNTYPDQLNKITMKRDGFYEKLIESGVKYDMKKYSFDEICDSYKSKIDYFKNEWEQRSITMCNSKCSANFVNEWITDNVLR